MPPLRGMSHSARNREIMRRIGVDVPPGKPGRYQENPMGADPSPIGFENWSQPAQQRWLEFSLGFDWEYVWVEYWRRLE